MITEKSRKRKGIQIARANRIYKERVKDTAESTERF